MKLLIFWIVSIIASYVMDNLNMLIVLKDIVDNGYRIDIKKLSEFTNQISSDVNNNLSIIKFIPIANMTVPLLTIIQYNNNKSFILDQIRVLDVLIPMTKDEKKEYTKNPTLINALLINAKPELKNKKEDIKEELKVKYVKVSYIDGDDRSIIYFKIEKKDIFITTVEGPAAKLSIADYKLNEFIDSVVKIIRKVSKNTSDNLLEYFDRFEDSNLVLNLDKFLGKNIEEQSTQLTISEQKKRLEELKLDLLNEKIQKDEQCEDREQSKVLKK